MRTSFALHLGRMKFPSMPILIRNLTLVALVSLFCNQVLAQCPTCPGDVSGDGDRNGADIQVLVDCLLQNASTSGACGCADLDNSGALDVAADFPLMVSLLRSSPVPCPVHSLTLTTNDPLVGVGRSIGCTVSLAQPAPIGGVYISLASLDPSTATIAPASLVIPADQSSAPATIAGVSVGVTTLTADAFNSPQASATIGVTRAVISLGTGLVVIPGQAAGLPVSLTDPAPDNVTITFISLSPSKASITPTVNIPQGSQTPAANPQVSGLAVGSSIIRASAPNYGPDEREVLVTANVITFEPAGLSAVEGVTSDITLNLQNPAPAGGQMINLLTQPPGHASVPAQVTVPAGETAIPVPVTGVAAGTTSLIASAADILSASASISVVRAALNLPNLIIGNDLQVPILVGMNAPAPPGNLMVHLASANPSKVRLAPSPGVAGFGTLDIQINAGCPCFGDPTVYVQALNHTGTDSEQVVITATADGYEGASATITLVPSGFVRGSTSFQTVVAAPPSPIYVAPARLAPDTLIFDPLYDVQSLRGGLSVDVQVDNSYPAVGTLAPMTLTFNGGDSTLVAYFSPGPNAGSTTITALPPSGFSTPAAGANAIDINVVARAINLSSATIGNNLQVFMYASLTAPAPPGGLQLTLSSAAPSKILLSSDYYTAGAASVMVNVPEASYVSYFYAQALNHLVTSSEPVEITASAGINSGYDDGSATMTLVPSGFVASQSAISATIGAPTPIQFRSVWLDPDTLTFDSSHNQAIRAGLSVDVPLTNSHPSVGSVPALVAFSGPDATATVTFVPGPDTGTTTITALPPSAEFQTPAGNANSIAVTVFAQAITLGGLTIGGNLQAPEGVNLTAPAVGDVVVTLNSSPPERVLFAPDAETIGTPTLQVTVPDGQSSLPVNSLFYVQALEHTDAQSETVTITASAAGYQLGTANVTINPSGLVASTGGISTTTFSQNTDITVSSAWLTPDTLSVISSDQVQPIRAGLSVDVPVTKPGDAVGEITASPLTFVGNQYSAVTQFDPGVVGTTLITIQTPPGFATPHAAYRTIVATVRAPRIITFDAIVGEDLQVAMPVSLEAEPPNPVLVTLSVNNGGIARISSDPTSEGGTTLSFNQPAHQTFVATIYVQGLSQEYSTKLRAEAGGYADGLTDIDVHPSGFAVAQDFLDTTLGSSPTSIYIYPSRLDPTTLNTNPFMAGYFQQLRGGLNVTVDLSINPVIGELPSSVSFSGGQDSASAEFTPLSPGTATILVLRPMQPPNSFDLPSNHDQVAVTVSGP